MRRSLSCILFFFLFLPLQAKEYKVLRSTVRVEPLRDGGLAVEEENLYLFTEGRFSYVFRTVPLQRRGGGRIEEILKDGLPLPTEGLPRGERKSVNSGSNGSSLLPRTSPGASHCVILSMISSRSVMKVEPTASNLFPMTAVT